MSLKLCLSDLQEETGVLPGMTTVPAQQHATCETGPFEQQLVAAGQEDREAVASEAGQHCALQDELMRQAEGEEGVAGPAAHAGGNGGAAGGDGGAAGGDGGAAAGHGGAAGGDGGAAAGHGDDHACGGGGDEHKRGDGKSEKRSEGASKVRGFKDRREWERSSSLMKVG